MRSRKFMYLGLGALAVLIATGLLVFRSLPACPTYQGRLLDQWVMDLLSPHPQARERAAAAVKAVGKDGVPRLIELLEAQDTPWKKRGWNYGLKLPLPIRRRVLGSFAPPGASTRRVAAAQALTLLGEEAREAAPALARALGDPVMEVHWQAVTALGSLGRAAVPELIRSLQSTHAVVRRGAVHALGRIPSGWEPALPALVEALEDNDPQVRAAAAESLAALAGRGGLVQMRLIEALERGQGPGPEAAAKVIAGMEQRLRAAIPALRKLAREGTAPARRQALETLGVLRAADADSVALFIGGLEDADPQVRLASVKALAQVSWRAGPAVERLASLLSDPSVEIRQWTALTLGRMGAQARAATARLEAALKDEAEPVRAAARQALDKIQGQSPP